MTLMSWKLKNSKFNVSDAQFLTVSRSFHRWTKENVQQRTNPLASRLFEGQLQFHFRKKPQYDPEKVEKNASCFIF